MLQKVASNNFLFQNLSQDQKEAIYNVMYRTVVAAGETVIKQRDEGDKFYILIEGCYNIFVDDKMIGRIDDPGNCFGELSLLYGKRRTATVVAVSNGVLWTLERKAFKAILMRRIAHVDLFKIIKQVDVFKRLSKLHIQKLCERLQRRCVSNGEIIVTAGEDGDKFYILLKGSADAFTDSPTEGRVREL